MSQVLVKWRDLELRIGLGGNLKFEIGLEGPRLASNSGYFVGVKRIIAT